MSRCPTLLTCLLLALLLPCGCHGDSRPAQLPDLTLPPVRIGSFNIQVFGVTKMSKPDVVDILLKTLLRYDLVFIMEIRDVSGQAIVSLLRQLNEKIAEPQSQFQLVISDRLGRTSSKEQYAYLYRRSHFELLDTFQYEDSDDKFERPPYGARFQVTGAEGIRTLGLIGIHVAPRDAQNELEALHGVQKLVKARWNDDNLLIVGDFNADCTYLSRHDREDLLLRRDAALDWQIDACHETTAVRTSCLYDRIIASGEELQNSLLPGSNEVFYFDAEYQLNLTMAERVSDHYPVEVRLAGEIVSDAIRRLEPLRSVEFTQPAVSQQAALSLCQAAAERPASALGFSLVCLRASRSEAPHSAVARSAEVRDAGAALQSLIATFPNVLHPHSPSLARHLQLQELPSSTSLVVVEVACEYATSPAACRVRVTGAGEAEKFAE